MVSPPKSLFSSHISIVRMIRRRTRFIPTTQRMIKSLFVVLSFNPKAAHAARATTGARFSLCESQSRAFCTQLCIEGLVGGRPLDHSCPKSSKRVRKGISSIVGISGCSDVNSCGEADAIHINPWGCKVPEELCSWCTLDDPPQIQDLGPISFRDTGAEYTWLGTCQLTDITSVF